MAMSANRDAFNCSASPTSLGDVSLQKTILGMDAGCGMKSTRSTLSY